MRRHESCVGEGQPGPSFATAKTAALKLVRYCQANDWSGHDPYDALNSRLFRALPVLDHRLPRLALTQLLKRSPIDFRRLLLVPKTQNPKGLALFLSALVRLAKLGLAAEDHVGVLAAKIASLRSPDRHYWCWGYSFPWQTRHVFVPRHAPNLVCTAFTADALLDACENFGQASFLEMAASAAEYILERLYWTEGESGACLSYPTPSSRSRVHNANFLGAALLCRVYRHTGDKKFLDPALNVARYSASRQREDGSWPYGEHSSQGWIDNFHTGYNLCALQMISECIETTEFESQVRRGFDFYRSSFFTADGVPKYFHNRIYPLDIHCAAQSIITLLAFKNMGRENVDLAHAVFRWAMGNMWDEQGYFYYQRLPGYANKISYIRWSQAWMLLALSILLEDDGGA